MSSRRSDVRGESALGLFLDRYFYPEIIKTGMCDSFIRNHEIITQKKGIDICMVSNGKTENIDEKAQLYSIGKPLPSFVVEIDFYSEEYNTLLDGWFVSPKNETDSYLFVWINRASTDLLYRIISEDFEEVEVALVKKGKIKDYLSQKGYPLSRIKKTAAGIREGKIKSASGDGFHFSYTTDRPEKPINIVLEKQLIDSLATARFLVTKEKVMEM